MKKKVKIGIFVDGDFIPSYDGASNRFHYLSRYLALNGVEIVIFHGYKFWSDIRLIRKEPFKTYLLPSQTYYSNLELIASLIKKESISIIQFDNLEPILLQGLKLSKITGAKLVSEMHYVVRNLAKKLGSTPTRINEITKMEKIVGKSVDHLITLSRNDVKYLKKYMGIAQSRLSVIPSGVDINEIKYFGPNFNNKNIIFLGNLYFKPNEDAVRRIRKLLYPKLIRYGFKFTIAGDFPAKLRTELETDGFKFVGTLPDLNQLFATATFALAPIDENTGMRIKLLNYLAAGIPTIATKNAISGFRNSNIFFVEDDFTKYHKKILELWNDKKTTLKKSYEGRIEIEKNYDWNAIAKQTQLVYEKILEQKNTYKDLGNFGLLDTKEPVWLQEAMEKKRFKQRVTAKLPTNFSYVVLNKNGSDVYKVEKLIALEGMPGAGKTTFIKKYIKTKNTIYIPQLEIAKNILRENDLETSKQFLLAEITKTKQLEKMSKKFREIIMDRTFFTTLAYCYARSRLNNTMEEYQSLLRVYKSIKNEITFPTHVIFLDVTVQESINRRAKYANDPIYEHWFNPEFLGYIREFYQKEITKFFPTVLLSLDTSDMNSDQVADKIKQVLC